MELLTDEGWLNVPAGDDSEMQQLPIGVIDHLHLEGIRYGATANEKEVGGVRRSWFEQNVSRADLERAITWPCWITNRLPRPASRPSEIPGGDGATPPGYRAWRPSTGQGRGVARA